MRIKGARGSLEAFPVTEDLRVLAVGDTGHPLIFASHRFQTQSYHQQDMVEHTAMVIEAAEKLMAPGVRQVDCVFAAC